MPSRFASPPDIATPCHVSIKESSHIRLRHITPKKESRHTSLQNTTPLRKYDASVLVMNLRAMCLGEFEVDVFEVVLHFCSSPNGLFFFSFRSTKFFPPPDFWLPIIVWPSFWCLPPIPLYATLILTLPHKSCPLPVHARQVGTSWGWYRRPRGNPGK